MFLIIITPSSSGSSSARRVSSNVSKYVSFLSRIKEYKIFLALLDPILFGLGLLDPECKCDIILPNVCHYLPNATMCHAEKFQEHVVRYNFSCFTIMLAAFSSIELLLWQNTDLQVSLTCCRQTIPRWRCVSRKLTSFHELFVDRGRQSCPCVQEW